MSTEPNLNKNPDQSPLDGQTGVHLVVVFGGQSAEHDVSCVSAAHVINAVDHQFYRVTPVGIDRDGTWSIADDAAMSIANGDDVQSPVEPTGTPTSAAGIVADAKAAAAAAAQPLIFLPILHGPNGEDGTVQGLFEMMDVAYAGCGVLASATAMDKTITKEILRAAGIPQAEHRSLRQCDDSPAVRTRIAEALGYPCFVKPANMGSSVGVSKANTRTELDAAIELAFSYDEWIVIEEGIDGREIEVAVLGNVDPIVSVPGEISLGDEWYSYDDKYVNNASTGIIPANLDSERTAELQELTRNVFAALRCEGLARCDFFYEDPDTGGRGFLCNEVNTLPGFTPISMYPKMMNASGVTYPQIIQRSIELGLDRYARKRRNTSR